MKRRIPAMDASDLRIFEAVARLGSMSLAGAELNTVQSNVTARIRALEDEIGTRRVVPT
jgi:LysR family transcriptional regulator, cell division regulator